MKQDVMVIPLRVPREVGRGWKMEAVKQDKSVQRWILDRLNVRVAQNTEQGSTKSGRNPEVGGKVTGENPVAHSSSSAPIERKVVVMKEFTCRVCGKPTDGQFVCKACAEVKS